MVLHAALQLDRAADGLRCASRILWGRLERSSPQGAPPRVKRCVSKAMRFGTSGGFSAMAKVPGVSLVATARHRGPIELFPRALIGVRLGDGRC